MVLKFIVVTGIFAILLALLAFIKTPKEVTNNFFKEGYWVMIGAFILIYWLAVYLHSKS